MKRGFVRRRPKCDVMAASTGKAHRKKKSGAKADKRKQAKQKRIQNVGQVSQKQGSAAEGADAQTVLSAQQKERQAGNNPRAFMVSSGKARSAAARNAEREQRRLQGAARKTSSRRHSPIRAKPVLRGSRACLPPCIAAYLQCLS